MTLEQVELFSASKVLALIANGAIAGTLILKEAMMLQLTHLI
jgi:hypothetical protein